MLAFPETDKSLLVRLDWTDDMRWTEIVKAATDPYVDGFTANLQAVDDPGFDGMDGATVANAAVDQLNHACIFFVDAQTIAHPDSPILCIGLYEGEEPFRVVPSEMWSVENNLSLANMDYYQFSEAVGPDGVFRGFV